MKKNERRKGGHAFSPLCKVLLAFILISGVGVLSSKADDSHAQDTRLTFSVKNATVKSVLDRIEKSTGFSFMYENNVMDLNSKVDFEAKNESVESVLNRLLSDEVTYRIVGKHILLFRSEKQPAAKVMDVVDVQQQQRTVTGKVTDQNGEPLPGATVMVKGTTQGTITDAEGNYSLSNVPDDATLVFSFVGMETQEINVDNRTRINVILQEEAIALEEVVAIGYGTMRREEVTSSIVSVKSEDFVKGAVSDAAQLIKGKVPGLAITTHSGDPTAVSAIMLRGNSSLLGSYTPLVIIDGVPGSLSSVPPEDIESIDVLKDGSAAAIYGTRGTNGVIIVTTKSSKFNQKPTIEYSGYLSTSNIKKKLDFLDADELRQKWDEGYFFTGANLKDFGSSTDWLGEITRTPFSHVHNIIFKGGSQNTSLTASINYRNHEGIFIQSDNQRYAGRFNISHSMFDNKFITNMEVIASEQKYWTGGDGYSFNGYIYRQAIIRNPTEPIKNEDGSWFERDVYFYDNPVAYLKETIGENRYRNLRFTANFTYQPTESFNIKGLYTRKGNSNIRGYYETKDHVSTTKYGSNGYASRGTDDYIGNFVELTANYQKDTNNHRFTVLGGYSYEDNTSEGFWVRNKYFPTDAYTYNNIGMGDALRKGEAGMSSSKSSDKLIALFSRVTYSYKDKYLLMASIRREGSSRFGENHKWGNFPGFSLGWRINEESFMEPFKWIDNLKLRAGFGVTGINVASSYNSLSSLSYSDYFLYNGEWVRKLVPSRNANPDLRWEKKEEFNIGLDFDLFNNRFGGSIDIYNRLTKDALWNYNVPTPPYLYGTIMANVGKIRNRGFETLLKFIPFRNNNFNWQADITYSTNKNKLVSLTSDKFQTTNDYFYEGYTGEPIQIETHRVKIGGPIGEFYGLKSVDITDDGIWIIEKPDGSRIPATESSTDDRQVLGNGIPKHYLSFNNHFVYRNWDLSINMRGAFGFQILNFSRMFYENPTIGYNMLDAAFDKVYGKAVLSDVQRYVSYYVEDGDYWKIDNITLGYTFPLKNKYINNLRIYTSGLNLFTFTGYKGIDPEVQQTGLSPGNDDRDKYPTTRTFTFGVNVTF